jgi:hypothetical protein
MRKTMNPTFLLDGEKVVGINLDADFCAEHEWGIEQLRRRLGISEDPISQGLLGIDGRKTTEFPEEYFALPDVDGYKLLVFCDNVKRWDNFEYLAREMHLGGNTPIRAAWDESSFAIAIKGKEVEFIQQLFEAFKNKDVAIWLGGGGAFGNAGLVIVIASLVREEHKAVMLKADESRKRLLEAVKATGIEEKLKAAGKGFFEDKGYLALSPRWVDEKETAIHFWLNPNDQRKDNCGWFTLQDLLDWIEGKGPIPVKAAT